MRLGLHALLLYLQEGEHASVVSCIHIHIQTNYSKVLVQEQGHINTSKNMSNGGDLRGGSSLTRVTSTVTARCHHRFLLCVWKHSLYACTVWRVPVLKHVDTACVYRYHHCVNQCRIFGISISPSLQEIFENVYTQCTAIITSSRHHYITTCPPHVRFTAWMTSYRHTRTSLTRPYFG